MKPGRSTPTGRTRNVFVQNQVRPNPKWWDRTGTVIECKDYDQYVIKVDGTGHSTTRNRKFLRMLSLIHRRLPNSPLPMEPTSGSNAPVLPLVHNPPQSRNITVGIFSLVPLPPGGVLIHGHWPWPRARRCIVVDGDEAGGALLKQKLWEPMTMGSWLVFHAFWHKWSCSGHKRHFHLNKNTWET